MSDQQQGREGPDVVSERDPGLPASEEGTGIIPEDETDLGNTHLPESESDTGLLNDEDRGPPQSWPGEGSPGTIPPPG